MERLNKFLAHAGIGSRRHCDEVIQQGRVKVDGQVVRELATQVSPDQEVTVDGQPLHAEKLVYWVVNKPRGYLCTNSDPAGRARVIDLVPHVSQRVYTVGRLDEDSEGLLLLTNDGELAFRLMHPRFGVEKKYLVQVAGKPNRDDLEQLLKGVWLSDGHVHATRVKRLRSQGDSTWLEIVLSEGKNREIRRMLARLNHKVLHLRRLAIGPVYLGRLRSGKSRPLTVEELARLRGAAEHAGKGSGQPPGARRRSKRRPTEAAASQGGKDTLGGKQARVSSDTSPEGPPEGGRPRRRHAPPLIGLKKRRGPRPQERHKP